MDITLTPEIEVALTEQAQQRGIPPEQLALESLRHHFVMTSQNMPTTTLTGTLADFLAGSVGVLHSSEHVPGGAKLSETKSTAFTNALLKKRQQGRL